MPKRLFPIFWRLHFRESGVTCGRRDLFHKLSSGDHFNFQESVLGEP
jgi:hypothetical protein